MQIPFPPALRVALLAASLSAPLLCWSETLYVSDQFEVPLRTGMTTEHAILRMLPSGTAVEMLEVDKENGYTRVRTQSGVEGYRKCLTHDIHLAGALRRRIGEAPDFELVAAGPLSITCFRYRPDRLHEDAARLDRLNRLLLAEVQEEGDVFLTGTELAGRFALRACILNFRTEEADLDTLLGVIRAAGERLVNC